MSLLFDAHNHLQDAALTPHRDRIAQDLAGAGVRALVVNGTCESDWPEVAALCSKCSTLSLLPSFGLHPWDAGNRTPDWQQRLLAQLDANSRAFVGEIGLDRWILDRARPDDARLAGLRRAPLDEQLEVFRWQLALAAERKLPATIHCLDAFGALHDTLRSSPLPGRGFLLHAYSGPAERVALFAQLGAYFSFNGAFLSPSYSRRLEAFRLVPSERLLVETDAPAMRLPVDRERFSLPVTSDGQAPNHPANLAAHPRRRR